MGFRVDDVETARAEMEAAGVEFLGPVQRTEGAAWSHFPGPDGNVYEIISRRYNGEMSGGAGGSRHPWESRKPPERAC